MSNSGGGDASPSTLPVDKPMRLGYFRCLFSSRLFKLSSLFFHFFIWFIKGMNITFHLIIVSPKCWFKGECRVLFKVIWPKSNNFVIIYWPKLPKGYTVGRHPLSSFNLYYKLRLYFKSRLFISAVVRGFYPPKVLEARIPSHNFSMKNRIYFLWHIFYAVLKEIKIIKLQSIYLFIWLLY